MQIKTETRVGIFVIIAIGIFLYMSVFLGVFRFDRGHYTSYIVYFDDVSGLEKKASVKMAGVSIGWVDAIELISDHEQQAKATIMVLKKYHIHANAYAIVRQEGLLGTKYLEIIPGDPLLPLLQPEQALGRPGRAPASMDEILYKVHKIASNIEDVTGTLKNSLGGLQGRESFQDIVHHFSKTTESIAAFSEKLDRILSQNEGNISSFISDMREFVQEIKTSAPEWGRDMQRLSNKIESEFIPDLTSNINRIATVFDRDFSGLSRQAESSFKNINAITAKIDDGQGVIGKLINDDSTYLDLKDAVAGLKNYFVKIDKLSIVIDAHGEYMYRPAEHVPFEDAKGYFDVRLHPNEDHFYIFQLVGSQKGTIRRESLIKNWFDERGQIILPGQFLEKNAYLPELIGRIDTLKRMEDTFKYGLQVGKIFKNICVRFGMFENSVGAALDFEIPFSTEKFRWVTSLEAFDFRGRDRINDARPHFKWINRVFVMRNIYATFGADDFVSKENANGFFGMGLRFCDDDLKYIASKIGFLGLSS